MWVLKYRQQISSHFKFVVDDCTLIHFILLLVFVDLICLTTVTNWTRLLSIAVKMLSPLLSSFLMWTGFWTLQVQILHLSSVFDKIRCQLIVYQWSRTLTAVCPFAFKFLLVWKFTNYMSWKCSQTLLSLLQNMSFSTCSRKSQTESNFKVKFTFLFQMLFVTDPTRNRSWCTFRICTTSWRLAWHTWPCRGMVLVRARHAKLRSRSTRIQCQNARSVARTTRNTLWNTLRRVMMRGNLWDMWLLPVPQWRNRLYNTLQSQL